MAEEAEVDLVEIAPLAKPPVCKLMDYGKFKYREAKKAHEAKPQTEADPRQRGKVPVPNRRVLTIRSAAQLDQVAQLDLSVRPLSLPRTELYLFDVDLLLFELGFVSFFRLAVLELTVVHQLADGRLGKRSNFHQIDFGFLGHFQGLGDRHDADLLAGGSDQAHFGRVDLDVDALRSLRGDVASSRKLKTKPYSPLWPRCGGGR